MHDIQQENKGAFWLEATLDELRTCDAVVVVPGYQTSSGTLAEIDEAKKLGLPVFYGEVVHIEGFPTLLAPFYWKNEAGTSNLEGWIKFWRSFNGQA